MREVGGWCGGGLTEPVVHVHCCGGAFEDSESADDGWGHAVLGLVDLEVLKRAFGLRAPVFAGVDLDFAKGVRFGSGGLCWRVCQSGGTVCLQLNGSYHSRNLYSLCIE